MADNQDTSKDIFTQTKEMFDHLNLDQKTRFLGQEAVSTVFEAIQCMVDFMGSEFENMFKGSSSTAQKPAPAGESSETES